MFDICCSLLCCTWPYVNAKTIDKIRKTWKIGSLLSNSCVKDTLSYASLFIGPRDPPPSSGRGLSQSIRSCGCGTWAIRMAPRRPDWIWPRCTTPVTPTTSSMPSQWFGLLNWSSFSGPHGFAPEPQLCAIPTQYSDQILGSAKRSFDEQS